VLKQEIRKNTGRLVGVMGEGALTPTLAYLLDDRVYGYWKDLWGGRVALSAPGPGQRPSKGSRHAWSYGYPVLRAAPKCNARERARAERWLAECDLQGASTFERTRGNLLAVREDLLPPYITITVVTDAARLVPHQG
jgi:hypothetical protein